MSFEPLLYDLISRRKGIFSGLSSSGDPIGGRTVLIKTDIDFEEIGNQQFLLNELAESTSEEEVALAKYFDNYEDNNLRINNADTFDLTDLYS